VVDGKKLLSSEGTTQGDPIAMSLYSLSILPLLQSVIRAYPGENGNIGVRHVAFADDLSGGGKISCLLNWWLDVLSLGPAVGYFPNAKKSWLIVKEKYVNEAENLFKGLSVNITTEGQKHLGAVLVQIATKKNSSPVKLKSGQKSFAI